MEQRLISQEIYNQLPQQLKELTFNFQGREKDIVLLSCLAVFSNCLPNVYGVYDRDIVYPHLYVMIIAPAASGKGVMNYSRKLIEPIHDKILGKSKKLLLEYEKKRKKGKDDVCPPFETKILPANISTSEMYSLMGASTHGLIIIESEADTMSNMLKNDWSNYSDVLRKAFHHEPISISRKMEKIFEDIKEPKLAMLISGTPDQLQPLIKSKGNGLFSRFIIYNFDEISAFKNVFADKSLDELSVFNEMGKKVYEFYGSLMNIQNPIQFSFSEEQENYFLENIDFIRTDIINNYSQGFLSNLHRHGLIQFKIAMILTAIRNMDFELHSKQEIVCSDTDFNLAFELTKTLLRHSLFTYNNLEEGILSIQDEEILFSLKDTFTRDEILKIGENLNIPKRTIDDKLAQWKRKRLIKKLDKSKYKKL